MTPHVFRVARAGVTHRLLAASTIVVMLISSFATAPAQAADIAEVSAAEKQPVGNSSPDKQSTDNLDPALLARMRQQEALQPAVQLVRSEIDRLPGSGFTSLAFEDNALAVYWKGELPASMSNAMVLARQFGAVEVRPARYSKAETDDVIARILAVSEPGSDLNSIEARYDGSGIEIERMAPTVADRARQKAAGSGRTLMSLEEVLSRVDLGGVAVKVKEGGLPMKQTACAGGVCSRRDDQPAWNGGTYLKIPGTAKGTLQCTSGFGVTKGSESYLAVASHCANKTNKFYDLPGELVGGVYDDDWSLDIMLINARGWGKIFDGTPTTDYAKAVKSTGGMIVNELLCQSGSTTGTLCWLQTMGTKSAVNICDSDGECFNIFDIEYALQQQGYVGSQGGDSGAPVFALDGTGVRIKGVVSGVLASDQRMLTYQGWESISSRFGLSGVVTR